MASYPFSGNHNAQSYPHEDPYSRAPQHFAPYPSHPDRDDEYDEAAHLKNTRDEHAYQDRYDDFSAAYPTQQAYDSTDHQYNDRGNNTMAAEKVYDDGYAGRKGNSIWTRDDKRAFAERGAAAKIFRSLFCFLVIGVIIVLSIILLILTFVRPPNVGISSVGVPNQSGVSYDNGAFGFNVSVDLSISNPNAISATLSSLSVKAYNPQDKTVVLGSGQVTDSKIAANANTTIDFPFRIQYNQTQDPDLSILTDIANKCGISLSNILGGDSSQVGDLNFDFDVHAKVSVLSLSIPIKFTTAASFPCPLQASSLQDAVGGFLSQFTGRDVQDNQQLVRRRLEAAVKEGQGQFEMRGLSAFDLMLASTNELVKRYSGARTGSVQHDAL